ncbi:MAG: hypothetical protein ACNA8S_06665 [Deferrisomatales bacterium]
MEERRFVAAPLLTVGDDAAFLRCKVVVGHGEHPLERGLVGANLTLPDAHHVLLSAPSPVVHF